MKPTLLTLAAAATLALSACGGAPATQSADSEEKLSVAAAFYPLVHASQTAGGDRVEVTSLTTPGQEPHDLELSPQQMASLSRADVVVYQKGFQPAVDEAITQAKPEHVIDVAEFAHLESEPDGEHAQAPDETHDHDHDDEAHDHDHGDEAHDHDHDAHDHGGTDPHFWLDPTRLADVSVAIGDKLAKVDPEHAEDYRRNTEAAASQLSDLDKEYSTGLRQCERREIITGHSAFGYLARKYDLEQIGIAGISPDEEPSPARIAEVQKLAKEHGATTIFFETLTSDAVAKSIAGDLGLKTAVLDPLEGITDQSAGDDYPSIMRANLKAIMAANGCS